MAAETLVHFGSSHEQPGPMPSLYFALWESDRRPVIGTGMQGSLALKDPFRAATYREIPHIAVRWPNLHGPSRSCAWAHVR